MQKIIDTHIHVWDLDRLYYSWLDNDTSVLKRNYFLAELEEEKKDAGVTNGILVQAANSTEETDYMLSVAVASGWIDGVVGWLPLELPATVDSLLTAEYNGNRYLKGIRHLIHDEPDAGWLLQPPVIESLKILAAHGLVYDLVGIKTEHIETALKVAAQVPGLSLIFDHMNQPPIAAKEKFGKWGKLMQTAAEHPQFFIKISGLGLTAQNPFAWTSEDIKPYIAFVIEHFGVSRCCCGGDWPVSLLAGSYSYTWHQYKNAFASLLNEKEQQQLLSENATAIYHL